MITKIASILAAALILGSVSSASAAVTHRSARHVRHYHSHPVTILLYPQVNDVFANF
jgi:hypothetical protein